MIRGLYGADVRLERKLKERLNKERGGAENLGEWNRESISKTAKGNRKK